MTRTADRDRILFLLKESEGLSNLRVKTELNLSDDRYKEVRDPLLREGLIQKYICRGGGIRLTRQGEKAVPHEEDGAESTVPKEADLYEPLAQFLRDQSEEDEVEATVCDTHVLKQRGQWQNPDITRIAVAYYRHLRRMHVVVTTYEVKQFPRWDVSVVYEAASHHRFSHQALVVLEWPNKENFSLTDPTHKLDQIARECQRSGVGLCTLHPHYSSYRLHPQIDAQPRQPPTDEDVDSWLDYVFSRDSEALSDFNKRASKVQGHEVQARSEAVTGP
jgi:hypothetical protein